MPRGHYPRKKTAMGNAPVIQKMAVEERESLREEVKEREEILRNVDELDHTITDRGRMESELRKKQEILDRDESLIARGREKDKIMREIKDIEERILKDRPTTNEMNLPLGTHESQKAVDKNIRFHRLHGTSLSRLQDLRKRLEPQDHRAHDLEYARPDVYDKRKTFFVGG